MATFTRNNAWNNGGTFANTDLLWYAKAVGQMQSRSLNDETSWWFFAAMHGQYITNDVNSGAPPNPTYNWARIPGPPNVPTTPLPASNVLNMYWDQCQHGTWYFPPWHRGYLFALENVLRGIVQELGGPANWALPYWNYFGPEDEFQMPPAFAQETLPDGSPNPLFVNARYGPNNDRNIFIPITSWGINQDCQQDPGYTGMHDDFYGGDVTDFGHADTLPGSLEWNPHNFVHGAIGGQNPGSRVRGLMSVPNTAALDPIFYLHHCNIDRMWASWNAAGNSNPQDANWLNGPTAVGERKFFMPNPDKSSWQYTPDMVKDISQLDYTYDDLTLGMEAVDRKTLRLRNLGLSIPESKSITAMAGDVTQELVGINQNSMSVDARGARTTVKLDSAGWNTVSKSIQEAASVDKAAPASAIPDEVYLQLEGVKGNDDSIVCSVSVNHQYAGHISLFGLTNATVKDGHHGGGGLTIRLNISKVVDALHLSNAADLNTLDVLIQPVNIIAEGNELTIDRVSVYRKGSNTNV